MVDAPTVSRRTALKGVGGLAVLGVGGYALTGGATATGDFDLQDPVTITSDDGSVQYVAIYGDSIVAWTGFDTPAQYFDIVIEVEVLDSDDTSLVDQQIHNTGVVDLDNENWGGDNEELSGAGTSGTIESAVGLDVDGNHDPTIDWHIIGTDPDGYGLPSNPVDASHLEVGTDGEAESFTVVLRSTYTWYDADQNEVFSKTFDASIPVEVTNEPEDASSSDGDADDGVVAA